MKILLSFSLLLSLCIPGYAVSYSTAAQANEILFLDAGVSDSDFLRKGIRPGIEVVMLEADRDGLEQMEEVLRERHNLSTVHIVSHAKPGQLLLGGRVLSLQEVEEASDMLRHLGEAFAADGDLMLYGCSLAEGENGIKFLDALSRATGADVAASTTETGSKHLGADWILEAQSGVIESSRVFTEATEQAYIAGTLAFSTGQFLTGSANTNNFSSQVIGPGGTIYGAWNYSGSGGTMKFATWNGSSWTEVPGSAITGASVAGQLTGLDNMNQLGTDSLKVDSNGDLHVALAISSSSGGVSSQRGLGYGFFDASTQTWTFRRLMIFSDPNGWNNLNNGGAVLILDSSENPHIVYGWSDANAPRWEYVEHAYFNGTSWNVTGTTNAKDGDVIDSLSGGAEIFGLDGSVDSSGNIHITYAREDANMVDGDIWYVKRTGSTWGTPVEIINVDDFIYPTMALDANDKVHVAWTTRPTNTSFTIKIATNASGSFVSSTAATDSEAGAAFQSAPLDLNLSINSLGNRFLSGSYSFSAGAPNYETIRGGLAVYTESSPGTWVREDVLTPTTSEGNFGYTSMAVKDDNTVSLLTGTRNDAYTSGNLKYAVGVPSSLPSGPSNSAPSFNDGATTSLTVNENASATSINSLLDINDTDSGDTLTWSVTSAPAKGSLGGFNATGSSNGSNVTPSGLTYTPTGNSTGSDSFAVQISDGTDTDSITVTVTITDVNPVITANSGSIAEDAGINDPVLTMAATGDTNGLNWSITGGNTGNAFAINGSTGAIRVNSALDFETTPSYTLSVAVDDEDAGSTADDTESVTITVTNVNDAPTVSLGAASGNLAEGNTPNNVITSITVNDDALGSETLSLSGTDAGSFQINGGNLEFTAAADFEIKSSYSVTVNVDDSSIPGTPDDSATYNLTITDVNEAPTLTLGAASGNLNENNTPDNVVTTITVNDDALGTESLSLSGTDAASFQITGGNLEFTGTADFETKASYSVTVNVDDSSIPGTPDDSATFTLTINDINDSPTLTLGATSGNLDENNTPNNVVTTITVNDDGQGTESLSLSGTDAASFQINGGNLEFTGTADFETKASYSVTVNVDDPSLPGTPDDSVTYTLTINDVNEAPTLTLGATSGNLDENNTPNNVVTTITVNDDALGTESLSLSGTDAGSFQINGGNLEFTDTADFETKASYSVTVEVDDTTLGSGPEDTASFTLTIQDVNDIPTVDNAVADFTVDEDAADSVFDLTNIFSDTEDNDADLVYTLESNSNPSLLSATIDAGTDELTLDYQLNQFGTAEITVRATDAGTLFAEDTFTVTVNSVNDIPTVDNAVADFAVDEDAPDSTFDLTNIFSDIEDADSDLTYSVESNTSPTVVNASINNSTDILTLEYQPNQNGPVTITVRATDSGVLFAEDTFTVTVNSVNDIPTVDNAVADFAVDEDAADNVFDLTDIFSDVEDADSDLTYSVETNTNSSLVTASINAGTDELTLDYQLNQFGVATLTVRATDAGTLFAEDTFIVTVNAVNDTPVVSNAVADFTVNEDAADSTFDLTNIFSDIEDADGDLIYTVETNSNPSLATASIDPGTDVLTLDYLADQSGMLTITLRATDSGTLFTEETFTVTVSKLVDLTVTALEDKDPVLAGNALPGNLIHQIKVMNNGPSDATNLVIDFTQTLPTGVVLDSATPNSGTESGGTWTLPTLAEGQMAILTLTMSIPGTVLGGTDTIITSGAVTSITEPLTATGDDAATVKTSVSSPASTGFDLETSLLGNLSNSLIEQLVKVTNNNPDPVPAFRILVSGLPDGVTLFNAHGTTTADIPFIVWDQELAPGAEAEVLMQYFSNTGLADFNPVYTIEFLTAAEATALLAPPPVGDPLAVVRFLQLADESMLVEWASTPGKTYYIQYTSDMTTYTTVLPGITAGATRTQWIDRGPPQTESHPSDVTGLRAYRVMEAK